MDQKLSFQGVQHTVHQPSKKYLPSTTIQSFNTSNLCSASSYSNSSFRLRIWFLMWRQLWISSTMATFLGVAAPLALYFFLLEQESSKLSFDWPHATRLRRLLRFHSSEAAKMKQNSIFFFKKCQISFGNFHCFNLSGKYRQCPIVKKGYFGNSSAIIYHYKSHGYFEYLFHIKMLVK